MTRMRVAHVAGALAFVAQPASAHLVETGFGAFYDGLVHVVVTPADLLVVVALALLAGQGGAATARLAVFALPLAWLAGALIGANIPSSSALPVLTTGTFLVAGALVALNAGVRRAGVAVLAIAAGLVHGLVNGATMGGASGASPLAMGGAVTAVLGLVAILSAEVSALPAGWPRIAVRVGGSWIAAAGLLMLGWLARGA